MFAGIPAKLQTSWVSTDPFIFAKGVAMPDYTHATSLILYVGVV